jgi:enamine deaminase RidA (YjgF/YER057c/UK114 family)
VEGTIQEKTAACIKNLKAVLTAAGSGIEKVVKVNIFITDMANFAVSQITHHAILSLFSANTICSPSP